MSFYDRLLPAVRNGGFSMEGNWVWCGSVIKGDDNLYHMFATMFSKDFPFHPNWLTNSRIVRAISDKPEGPYAYVDDVLSPRGTSYWDGLMTHNPTIHRSGDNYLLYYTGATYEFDVPTRSRPDVSASEKSIVRGNQRIGLAISRDLDGPWQRFDRPVLDVRDGYWDSWMTTNPAPMVLENGSILMLYKATDHEKGSVKYGAASASSYDQPFVRFDDTPIFDFDFSYEDVCIWYEGGNYKMLFNDLTGKITGEVRAGAYATSSDGKSWSIAESPKGYSRTVAWDDGKTSFQGSFERPQILVENGRATHLFSATGDGTSSFFDAKNTWNMVTPLKQE